MKKRKLITNGSQEFKFPYTGHPQQGHPQQRYYEYKTPVSFVHRVTIWIYFLGRLEFKSSALLVNGKKIMSIGKFKLSLLKINLND